MIYNYTPSNFEHSSTNSNGSGKSSLAMSALWALTGTIDPRPVSDAKVDDVVHDKASVSIGIVEDRAFVYFSELGNSQSIK
jgi:hypothetical protein